MKKIVFRCIMLVAMVRSNAQNIVQIEYFLDLDAGFGRNKVVPSTPGGDITGSFNIDLSQVPAGPHILFLRALDNTGVWGETIRKRIEVQPVNAGPANISLEYFFDQDPGFGNGVAFSISRPDSINSIALPVNTAVLSSGVHAVFFRTLDNYGRWGMSARRVVEILPASELRQIVSGEYFLDVDPGFGAGRKIEPISPDSAIGQSFMANISGSAPGQHSLYTRFLDNNGKWGYTVRRTIDVTSAPDTNYVVLLEYSINKDGGVGTSNQLQIPVPFVNGSYTFNVPYERSSVRPDTLYVRVKDASGVNWSLTKWLTFITQAPLPLQLLEFTGVLKNRQVELQWKTQNEINTSHFIIERSADGATFSQVGKLLAKRVVQSANYSFEDDLAAIVSRKLYYRLRKVDNDESFTFSSIVPIDLSANSGTIHLQPNPASGFVDLYSGSGLGFGKNPSVLITDAAGRVVLRQQLSQQVSQRINISNLHAGLYTLSVLNSAGMQSEKLIVK